MPFALTELKASLFCRRIGWSLGNALDFFGRKFQRRKVLIECRCGFRAGGFLRISFGDSEIALGEIRSELRALSFSDGIGPSGFP